MRLVLLEEGEGDIVAGINAEMKHSQVIRREKEW